jgi:hypothetical protein
MSANRKESQSVAMTCNSIDIRKRSSALNRAEQYRTLAEDVRTRAAKEPNPIVKAEWENLAKTYLRLAKQTDDGWNIELTYDPLKDGTNRS